MFSSELDIVSQCFSSNEIPPKESEEIIDGIVIKRIENLPCKGSSLIKAIGYDHENNIFYVVFKNNKTYRYFHTSLNLWQRFITTTGSIGRLYNQQIKGTYGGGEVDLLID
ncbi:MAG: KTSC domain-containing protein [Crocosphaera sp.]